MNCLSKKETQFKVPVLDIEPQKIKLEYTLENIAECDNKISQQRIGEIVNLSAMLLSYYYDIYHKNKTDERLKLLSDMINLLSNASMMEIDSAKKVYPEAARSKAILQFVREQCKDILEKDIIKVSTFKMKLMKICTEIDTLIYLNNQALFDIRFNPNGSNITDKNSRPNSDPDFIIKNGKETIYVELKAYIGREELPHRVEFKEWQFNNLKRKIDDGKKVFILQKHYLKNGTIIYQLYDLKELLQDDRYTWHECDLEVNKESHIYKHYIFCNNVETDVEFFEDIENTYSIQFTNGRYYSF